MSADFILFRALFAAHFFKFLFGQHTRNKRARKVSRTLTAALNVERRQHGEYKRAKKVNKHILHSVVKSNVKISFQHDFLRFASYISCY